MTDFKTQSKGFIPHSIYCLKQYTLSIFFKDLIAGITVGIVALPLAMAFAIASGLSPQSGIYCAVVAGFIISALGGSRTQIGGPTGAFVVVVSGIVAKYGVDGLFMCTLMAGVMLATLGLTGLGTAVKYIPRPVVIGFTNGIAVLIASTQLKDFFGLKIDHVSGDFIGRISEVFANFNTFSPLTSAFSYGTLLIIILIPKFSKKLPGSIVALALGTVVAALFNLPLETIQSKFGSIPQGLPHIEIPNFRPDLILALLSPAITIAMLGAIESLLSAVVADRLSDDKHNPNTELFAQGIANIASPLVGGLPATGAIARTATNIRSGAQTPVAGMIHALTLLLILLIAAPLVAYVPLSALAAILMVVSYNMGEWSEIRKILKLSKASISVWLITFLLTVFADLTVAVEAGMILAALLYIRKVTSTTSVNEITPEIAESEHAQSIYNNAPPEGVSIYRIRGPFLFGATDKLEIIYENLAKLKPVVILKILHMTAIDASGLHAFETLVKKIQASGRTAIVCGMHGQPAIFLQNAEFDKVIGKENFVPSLRQAMERAISLQ